MRNKRFNVFPFLVGSFVVIVPLFIIFVLFANPIYKYSTSETISAKVSEINTVNPGVVLNNIGFSSAILLQSFDGKIISTSSEDRQWMIVKQGQCVKAKLFKYAPWNFEKAGTFYGARLIQIINCQ